MKQRILKKIYKELHEEDRLYRKLHKEGKLHNVGKFGKSYACIYDIIFEENKKGLIVPIGILHKNKTHYTINKNLCIILKYRGKNLEIISNQIVPVEPSSGIRAYLHGRITRRELEELFN